MAETVARFEVARTGFIDADGRALGPLPAFAGDAEELIALYRAMVRARAFDDKAIALQRTGRLGTYASALGQEAVAVGVAAAMLPEDVLLPSHREHGAQLWRGVRLLELLLYWGGDERGSDFRDAREDFPVCVPVATHFPHGAGAALAFKLRGEARAAVCIAGDGATSKGDFYEALNLIGVWRLPAVFVIANNQWAISMPRAEQTAAETIAQKAIAAGIPGEQVDGNDVIAVRDATARALMRARAGDGGTLIEALTYRLADHTTADDASRYREETEVAPRRKLEPLLRLRRFLVREGHLDDAGDEALHAQCAAEVEAAAEGYLASKPEPPEAMFDHLFETLPADVAAQRAALLQAKGPGDG